jgi:hypothetical protein
MSPLPRNPAYGDAAKLEQLGNGLKQEHGTYGSLVQRNPVGRPTGSTGVPAPRPSQQQSVIRPEHAALAKELADAEVQRQQWRAAAQASPTPWVLAMADLTEREFQAAATKFYNVSPNVEY